jgi:hypothetical protein
MNDRPFFECPGCGKDISDEAQAHADSCTYHRAGRIDGKGTRKDSLMASAPRLALEERHETTSQTPGGRLGCPR